MGAPKRVITRANVMKVASVGLLALVALALFTDASAMEFEDDSVDPTEESSFYEHHGVAPSKHQEAPRRHHTAARAPHHKHAASLHRPLKQHPHPKTMSIKTHTKAPHKHAAAKPAAAKPAVIAHHFSVRQAEMEMEEGDTSDEAEFADTSLEQEDDAPVEDEDDEDLHMKAQAMVETIDDDSLEDDLDDLNEVDMKEEKQPAEAMATAAASTRQHHEWKPKPEQAVQTSEIKSDKHQESVLATIKAMRTRPNNKKTYPGQATVQAFKPAATSVLASKKRKAKKTKAFEVVEDEPAAFGKVKATGFLNDRSWMMGAGKSYGGYRKTGKAKANRQKRAQGEIEDFVASDNAESSAASRYSYGNVKRVVEGKEPTRFLQELHDGASRGHALLKPKFRSMRGQYRAPSTDDSESRANKKASKELQALLAAGGVKK